MVESPQKGNTVMTNDQLKREKLYTIAMILSSEMLRKGIITKREAAKIEKHFDRKYNPVIANLSKHP